MGKRGQLHRSGSQLRRGRTDKAARASLTLFPLVRERPLLDCPQSELKLHIYVASLNETCANNTANRSHPMPFTPPPASAGQTKGVPFGSASNVAADNKAAFDAFDQTAAGRGDPSKCKALLKFPNGAIFWSSKMAIDADGPAAGPGRRSGTQLDPGSGQDDTSLHFDNGKGLPSETIPYIVLPGGSFRANTGLAMGDLAVVIFKDKITAAICGDIGPTKKIGEGSIRVHEGIHPPAPDPCVRDGDGFCRRIHNVSIDEDVLFFVFPNSAPEDLDPNLLETTIQQGALQLYNTLRGA